MFEAIAISASNKEKIVNDNFQLQEALNRGVIDRSLTTPPTSPSSDGVYIPIATATGAWNGHENKLLWYNPDGYWKAIAPNEGMKIFSQVSGEIIVEYNSVDGWQAIEVSGIGGYITAMPIPKNFWQFDGNTVDVQSGKNLTIPFYLSSNDYEFFDSSKGKALKIISNDAFYNEEYELVMGEEFSISAWIANVGNITFSGSNYDTASESYLLTTKFNFDTNQKQIIFQSSFFDYTASPSSYASTTNFVENTGANNDEFHHVVLTRGYENTDTITKVYIDGQLIGEDTKVASVAIGRSQILNTINIGNFYQSGDSALLDNVRIYDRVLSAAEVMMLANE